MLDIGCGHLPVIKAVAVHIVSVDAISVIADSGVCADDAADLRRGGELPCAEDVLRGGEGARGDTEERRHILEDAVREADRQHVDALRGDVQLDGTRLRVIGPHAGFRIVIDAVDRHTVDALGAERRAGVLVPGQNDVGVRGGHGCRHLAGARDAVVLDSRIDGDVERRLGGGVLRRVDELHTGAEGVEGAIVVIGGVGLGHVHKAGCLVHDEAVAHVRVGVVLRRRPIGELRALDVCAHPCDVVVHIGVGLEEDGVAEAVGNHGLPVVGQAIAVIVSPERVEGALGELAAIDHGGCDMQHIRTGEVAAVGKFADVLRVHVLPDVLLHARDVARTLFLDLHRFQGGGTRRAVFVEGCGHSYVAVHREGRLAVLDLDGLGLRVGGEHREAVSEVSLVRRREDGDLGADLDGLGHLVGALEREGAVHGLRQGDGRRLRSRILRRRGVDGGDRGEHRARDEHGGHELLHKAAVAQAALGALDFPADTFHQKSPSFPLVVVYVYEKSKSGAAPAASSSGSPESPSSSKTSPCESSASRMRSMAGAVYPMVRATRPSSQSGWALER